jgi:hypothetical protein
LRLRCGTGRGGPWYGSPTGKVTRVTRARKGLILLGLYRAAPVFVTLANQPADEPAARHVRVGVVVDEPFHPLDVFLVQIEGGEHFAGRASERPAGFSMLLIHELLMAYYYYPAQAPIRPAARTKARHDPRHAPLAENRVACALVPRAGDGVAAPEGPGHFFSRAADSFKIPSSGVLKVERRLVRG